MCGRFTLHHSTKEIVDNFHIQHVLFDVNERYNIAPTQKIAVVTQSPDGERSLQGFKWGLVPSWAKDPSISSKTFNARCETLTEKPSFRSALKRRRCLIPADGFYEWKAQGAAKQPMHIRLQGGELYAFAGLWEEWKHGDETLRSCTIITGPPNDLVAPIHNRMPVILPKQAEEEWLAPDLETEELLMLLKPFPADQMEAFAVGSGVGAVANDSQVLIDPIGPNSA